MHSKIMILIWERWQRTRWAVITACLVLLSGWLMYVVTFIALDAAIAVTRISFLLGFLLLTFVLLVGHCETRDVDLMFPKRLFRYPVRTTTLLSVYVGYGVAAVVLQSLMLFGFDKLFFNSINYRWINLLVPVTVYIVLQTLSWLGGLVGFLGLILALTGVYALHENSPFSMTGNILCGIIILLCGTISFWCVSAYRHGAWINGQRLWDSFLSIFRRRPSKHFASPLRAQIWFELRQTGHLFPLAALCLIFLILGWMVALGLRSQFSIVVPVVFQSTIFSALIAGFLAFAVYHRDHVSGASSYWLRLPMATRTLAVARLHATAWSLAHVLVILTVVALAVAAHDWTRGTLDMNALLPVKSTLKYSTTLEIAAMTVLGLCGFALIYWTLLCLAPLLMIVSAAVLITWPIGDIAVTWLWNALAVGLSVGVLVAFYVAIRRNLITTASLLGAVCMFALLVVSLLAPWLYLPVELTKGLPNLNQWRQIIHLISAATLPFIPVVALPLLIDKLRHR